MHLHYLRFAIYSLWMKVLVLPQWTQGLTCFSCNSKADQGCNNDDLKNHFRKNMFSEKCFGSSAVCIKETIVVQHYYEEHYNLAEMKKYYAALDKAAECRGTGVPSASGVTSAPGGSGSTAGSAAGQPGGTAAAGPGAGDSQGGDIAAGGTTPGDPAAAAATEPADGEAAARRRRAVADNCPAFPSEFPASLTTVERSDERRLYSCGNRTDWHSKGHTSDCHTHSDGILMRTICICDGDLCNGATAQAAVPFLVLAAAMMHLQCVIG